MTDAELSYTTAQAVARFFPEDEGYAARLAEIRHEETALHQRLAALNAEAAKLRYCRCAIRRRVYGQDRAADVLLRRHGITS